MHTRMIESTFAELSILDKKTILAIYLDVTKDKTIISEESRTLHTALTSDKALEEKFEAIKNYLSSEVNVNKYVYKTLTQIIQETIESNQNTVTHFETPYLFTMNLSWKMSDFIALKDEAKEAIIKCLESSPPFLYSLAPSGRSALLRNILADKEKSVAEKWEALIYYCSKKSNSHRDTYGQIHYLVRITLEQFIFSLIEEKRFEAAYSYSKFSDRFSMYLVKQSILANAFKQEYLSIYNFEKSAYIKKHMKNEIVVKTFSNWHGEPHTASLAAYIWPVEMTLRVPVSFFYYHTRHHHNKAQVIIMLQNLSQLSELLSLEQKKLMMQQIAEIYTVKSKWSKSFDSKTLIASIDEMKDIKRTWYAMLDYVIANDDGVFKNNGSRLFSLISETAAERTNQIFSSNENRP
jgi:hypothetical protein